MKLNPTYAAIAILALGLGVSAHAEEEPFVMADANSQVGTAHFMSLQPVRDNMVLHVNGNNGLKAVPVEHLRSDREALNNGFMRIDRAQLHPNPTFQGTSGIQISHTDSDVKVVRPLAPVAPKPAAIATTAPAAPAGADATIASLFGGNNDEDEPESFHAALNGEKSPTTSIRHAWPLPAGVEQKISSGYGFRSDPFNHNASFHGGIDISAAAGTPILATAEGVVSQVDHSMGFGNFVAVKHRDGSESYYNHLSAQNVRIGQHVMQGQQVGALGSSGRSTGPHLDYRLKKGDETMNPMLSLHAPDNVSTRVASR